MAALDRQALSGKVQTVTGPIAPEALGQVLMHEHVLCDITPPAMRAKNDPGPEITLETVWAINYGRLKSARNYDIHLKDIAVSELGLMQRAGGGTVVELTCGGLRPDPNGLADIALATGVNLVMGCGWYVDDYQAAGDRQRTVDDFAQEIVAQITQGAWG